jgi:hypothetical protein
VSCELAPSDVSEGTGLDAQPATSHNGIGGAVMAYDCHIHVCFEIADAFELKHVAQEMLSSIATEDWSFNSKYDRDAAAMIEYFAEGSGTVSGPKGDLAMWGYVGNHADLTRFITATTPFWRSLFEREVMLDFWRIVIFFEAEQTKAAEVVDIRWDGGRKDRDPLMVTYYDRQSWCWYQV